MKKDIYVGSQSYDYQHELFRPIMTSDLVKKYNFIFPSEKFNVSFDAKKVLKDCKLMVAEVSNPTVAASIEMGWADIYKVPVVCAYLKGTALSSHLKLTCDVFIEYTDYEELLEKLTKAIENTAL